MTRVFAADVPPAIGDDQLLQMARAVCVEQPVAFALLQMFRRTAVAAVIVLAFAVAGGAYQNHQARIAAHDAFMIDHFVTGVSIRPPDTTVADAADNQQTQLAQWIVNDLAGGREESR